MLRQIIYSSISTNAPSYSDLYLILAKSRVKNALAGITGLLVFVEGVYFQLIEGDPEAVSNLMERISRDPRHCEITIIHDKMVEARLFPAWKMAYASCVQAELEKWSGLRDASSVAEITATLAKTPERIPEILAKLLGAQPKPDLA